jgi:hypothetical protein
MSKYIHHRILKIKETKTGKNPCLFHITWLKRWLDGWIGGCIWAHVSGGRGGEG